MVYQWKTQGLYSVSAKAAAVELDRIRQSSGALTPQAIVNESRPENAILHGCFEWNDTQAAEKYREQQARVIVANIVTVDKGDSGSEPIRAYVHVQGDYKPMSVVVQCREYSEEMLTTALRELRAFERKYKKLRELTPIWEALDNIEEK